MTNSIIQGATGGLQTDLALSYLIRQPKAVSKIAKAVILLHGVGSNEQDLFAIAPGLPGDVYVIAVRGPIAIGNNRFAWYNVDFSSGKPIIQAAQEAFSRELIRKFIKQVKEKYTIDEVYLGGFSQGAIMSNSIGLTHPADVKGIMSFSGRILQEIRPLVQKITDLQRLEVLVAHGVLDNTLPIQYAREAKEYLETLGVQLTYYEYNIGHQLSNEVLNDLNAWLQ
jgi:phospholipase/carboxylesterase